MLDQFIFFKANILSNFHPGLKGSLKRQRATSITETLITKFLNFSIRASYKSYSDVTVDHDVYTVILLNFIMI